MKQIAAWVKFVTEVPDELEERMQGNNADVNDQVQAQEEFRAGLEERKFKLLDVEVEELEPRPSQG